MEMMPMLSEAAQGEEAPGDPQGPSRRTPWESRAAPFGDSLSLDVPDRNKKRYPSSPQGSLTCSFRLAAKCKTRSRGML